LKKNFLGFVIGLFVTCAWAQDQTLIILHTNDHHGHYNSFDHGRGGLAAQKAFVDQVRSVAAQKGHQVLLLSGGDINTGTFESDLQKAEPDFKGMNRIGYDAMAVGNHEWDNPLETILKQKEWASFAFLSANTRFKDTKKHVFDSHMVICLPKGAPTCDLKVGILGLTTPETHELVSPEVIQNIEFTNPVLEAKKAIQQLKKEKVDLIVAVTHMGHDGPKRDYRGEIQYRDVLIAREVKGMDVIVGGHTQVPLPKPIQVKRTLVLQAHEWGKYVGKLELTFKKKKHGYRLNKRFDYALVPINPYEKQKSGEVETYVLPQGISKIEEDPSMLEFFTPYNKKADQLGNQAVGTLKNEMNGDRFLVRSQPMSIGAWITNSFRKESRSDFAMMNGGGIRASIKKGKVTKRDIHAVHPFGNTLITVPMSPQQVVDYVTVGYQMMIAAEQENLNKEKAKNNRDLKGGYPQWSGIKIIDQDKAISQIVSTDEKNPWKIDVENGKAKSSTKQQYLFSTINFIAKGGDGYPSIAEFNGYVNTGLPVDHLLIKYFSDIEK
jgi:5'-nucleotidase/UDP-sugar diphosphatase